MIMFKRLSAITLSAAGLMVPAAWTAVFLAGTETGFMHRPIEAAFRLVAETLLSVSCLAAAIGLLRNTRWARRLLFGSCGLLIAAVINAGSFHLFDAVSRNTTMASLCALVLATVLAVFIPHYRQSIKDTGGAGGMFLLSCGMLVYLLITTAGHYGQRCLDESGVHAGTLFLLILGTLLLVRFLLYTVFRGSPYFTSRN